MVTRASGLANMFETPRLDPGSSVSSRSGYSSPAVVTPSAGPPSARSVTSSPVSALEHPLGADHVHERVADEGVELDLLVAFRAQQEERREEVVEAAAGARDDEDAPRPERERLVERELEVGRVLRGRVRDDAGAGASAAASAPGETESRSPTTTSTSSPSESARSSPPSAAITVGVAGRLDDGARPRGDDDDIRLVHAFLRWHYPGQVLRVGGASAALSARSPELPGSLRGILDHPRYVTLKPRSPTGARSSTSSGVDPRLGRPTAEPRDDDLDVLESPSSSASTAPSARLRTHPATPSSSARCRALSLNHTPWTRPRTRMRRRTTVIAPSIRRLTGWRGAQARRPQ